MVEINKSADSIAVMRFYDPLTMEDTFYFLNKRQDDIVRGWLHINKLGTESVAETEEYQDIIRKKVIQVINGE